MDEISDIGRIRGLIHLLKNGTFELKGSDVQMFAEIMRWLAEDLPKKLEKDKVIGKEVITKAEE